MPKIVDNIELDEANEEFNYASDFVKHTNKLVYLTGKAGTGKTTFLRYLRETTSKNTVILAPTGVAAVNAGGQTIHSFFQIKPGVYIPGDKRLRKRADVDDIDRSTIYDHFKYFQDRLEVIKNLELLVIDEVSMVRCDLLDVVDRLLRVFRRKEAEPFGGVQVVLIGDTFQLPPIAYPNEWDILKTHYKSVFFFSSQAILENKPVYIELKKIYRQNEQEFINLLNRIRINQVSATELDILNSKHNPTFSPGKNSSYITLATHNNLVESTNITRLDDLSTELKIFEGIVTGNFPENIMPCEKMLKIKEGAQVMFTKNDKAKRYYSGKISKISKIEDNKIIIALSEDNNIIVEKQEWKHIKYTWNEESKRIEEEILGTFTQFPIRLAWAITVHKSQGLTFENVIADLGAAFAPGQVYVALSRCTSFNGLVLKTIIDRQAIKTDPEVLQFAQNETPSTLIIKELNAGKADFYYRQVREYITGLDFSAAYNNFVKAIKFRNDIETTIFKKYFVTTSKRLASFKKRSVGLQTEIERVKKDNIPIQSILATLKVDKMMMEAKITDQNEAAKLLLTKTKEFEKQLERSKDENLALSADKKYNMKKMQQLNKTIDGQLQKIADLKKTIEKMEVEVERLSNIKWYQRIFGRK